MSPRTNWFDLPDIGVGFRTSDSARMSSIDFTETLTEPKSLSGECHCGEKNVLLNAEYKPVAGADGRPRMKLVGTHCWLCRCDEHTPEAHARWTSEQRKDSTKPGSSTAMPGCGRKCSRGAAGVLLAEEFPTFEEWVRTNGSAALRDKYGILAHDPISGRTFYNAKGMRIVHIPDIRNCGCEVCREERKS